jgi:GDP-4-dehydro-6-deoxy-D-mannose reductase
MRVLVTGASGFTGTHLLKLLSAEGVEIFTHGPVPAFCGTYYDTPIGDLQALTGILSQVKPDYIFHLAGLAVAKSVVDYYLVNVLYAANLLQAMEDAGQRFVPVLLVGTSAEYGAVTPDQLPITEETPTRPYSHYGISKLAQTQMGELLAKSGRPIVIARPFNIIGRGMGDHLSVQSFARQIADIVRGKNEPIMTVGNLSSTRDFVDVEDVVRAYWRLIQVPAAFGKIVNICTGRAVSMGDLLNRLIALSGVSIEVRIDQGFFKPMDVPMHYGDPSRLYSILGYSFTTSLDQSLKEILENMLAE